MMMHVCAMHQKDGGIEYWDGLIEVSASLLKTEGGYFLLKDLIKKDLGLNSEHKLTLLSVSRVS